MESLLKSEEGLTLLEGCKENSIDVEFELHALQDILPRQLFHDHPEYFRKDNQDVRQQEFNMCFTSESAYEVIEKNVLEITNWLKPTTNRYYFWTDDVSNAFCNCANCKKYSNSEQALLYENKLQSILEKVNSAAQVAHLAHSQTLAPPVNVKPAEGIFLEYAAISRDYSEGLSQEYMENLEGNLKIFPKETTHILEYWLDVSMFSAWKKDRLVKLDWKKENFTRDLKTYKNLGINSNTTFAAWINKDYIDQFGLEHTNHVLLEYGNTLRNANNKIFIDADLHEWDDEYYANGLTDPWSQNKKDNTIFDFEIVDDCFNFYFITEDSSPKLSPYQGEQSVAEGDRVELIFLPTKKLHKYYCAEMSSEGNVLDYSAEYYRKIDNEWDFKTLTFTTNFHGIKCIYEGRISLEELSTLGIKDHVYLGIFRADFQGKEKVNWYSNKKPKSKEPDFHIPSAFEKISLNE